MHNYASYGNCLELMEHIGSKIPKTIEVPRSEMGTLKEFIIGHILDLPMQVRVPVMSFMISPGEHIHINVSSPTYPGIERFYKIGSGTETSFQIDGKYVGVEIFNGTETEIGDMPRIQIYDALLNISKSQNGATVYVSILNKPLADLIIPTVDRSGYSASGIKLLVTDGINDITSEYMYSADSQIENAKVFDITDLIEYELDASVGTGYLAKYYPSLLYNTAAQTFNPSAIFGGAGSRRDNAGTFVRDVVRKYCAIKGIDIPYVSSSSTAGVNAYGSEMYTPKDIRLYTNGNNKIWRV